MHSARICTRIDHSYGLIQHQEEEADKSYECEVCRVAFGALILVVCHALEEKCATEKYTVRYAEGPR